MAIPLIHDCDPGQDDAIALMAMLANPAVNVIAVTTVAGNVHVTKTARNAKQILELCGHGTVPVYAGAEHPLRRQLVTLESVFGETGLAGGEDLPDPAPIESEHAVDFLVRTLLAHRDQPLYVCATAPLTNLALAIQKNPDVVKGIAKLVIMGGCVYPEPLAGEMGNIPVAGTSGKAEYNFATDPDAARIVFTSGLQDITLIGLNVTRTLLFNQEWRDRLYAVGNRVASKAADILKAIKEMDTPAYKRIYGPKQKSADDPVRAVHDAAAGLYFDVPEFFTTEMVPVRIVTEDPPEIAGLSLPCASDAPHASSIPIRVATACQADKLFLHLIARLTQYSDRTP